MDRAEIVEALTAVGESLERRGLRGEMYLVGGAAIALAYDSRRATRDIDAVFEPKAAIYEAAAEVAERSGLPPGWLNDLSRASSQETIQRPRRSSRSQASGVWLPPLGCSLR
jgi:hypothetical protein